MPSVLNLQVQNVDTEEKRAQYTVSIVGCGPVGILYADAFAEAGYKVICNDENPNLLKRLTKNKNCCIPPELETRLKKHIDTGNLTTSNVRKSAVAQSDIIVLAINIRMDTKKKSDTLELEGAYKQVGSALKHGSLLIHGGNSGFDATEKLLKKTIENTSGLKEGADFLVAYSPLYLPKARPIKTLQDTELIIASTNQQSLDVATIVLKTLTSKVKQVEQVRLAELATLFKAVQQDICMALANELAIFCENTGMDYFKVRELINDEKSSFFPAIAEEENQKETYLLIESAENLNIKLRLPQLSRQINEERIKHAINLTQEALRSCDKNLRRAKVAVLGTSSQNTTTSKYIETATTKGARVTLYDPLLAKNETSDTIPVLKRSLSETVESADCLVILIGQEQFERLNLKRLKTVMRKPAMLVDLIGLTKPEKIQAEGFIYRGIGRGVDKS